MKHIKSFLLALTLSLTLSPAFIDQASAQDAPPPPPPPISTGSFFNTTIGWMSSFNTNNLWDSRGSFAAGVDSIQGAGNNLANSLRLSYEAWQPSPTASLAVESVTRNGGVAGAVISQQAGLGFNFKVFDTRLTAYADGGYDFATPNRDHLYAEVGLRAAKKMTKYTFIEIGIAQQLPRNAQVYSAGVGFTF